MFNAKRSDQFRIYNEAREFLIREPETLIALEKAVCDTVFEVVRSEIEVIANEYNEASYLYPFWQNYPPDERGRMPVGDQFPWIEVGEHVFRNKLPRLLAKQFAIKDIGLPTGPDTRLVLGGQMIKGVLKGLTDSCWLFLDIKSVGPRDDQDHAVMSHNQVSGDGIWATVSVGIRNTPMRAQGQRSSHDFHCAVAPVYVLSDSTVLPVIHIVVKPVYRMLTLGDKSSDLGQPLGKITIACIPNGLLLCANPKFLNNFPGLFFPGKDDKEKKLEKVRARVSFAILRQIDSWRVRTLTLSA